MKNLKLYAIVNKNKPVLNFLDLTETKDVKISSKEKLIEVEVREVEK